MKYCFAAFLCRTRRAGIKKKLWLLESGEGSLAQVDLQRQTWRTVARLPGFTRGIDFVGPLAFIGLSQVRESAVFSGIPLAERLSERTCGVWVVNVETGRTVGFLRFEAGVQEIFAVQVLRGMRFPELLEWTDERLANSYVLPDDAMADVVLRAETEELPSAVPIEQAAEAFRNGKLENRNPKATPRIEMTRNDRKEQKSKRFRFRISSQLRKEPS